MRTYSRKRPECTVIEDANNLCRLCLREPQVAVPIFTDDSDNVCAALALRIMICVGLEIKRDDHLPNKVCMECSTELQRYYTFRKKCATSYQKLKAHLEALKKMEIKEVKKELCMKFENNVDQNKELKLLSTPEKNLTVGINFENYMENERDNIGKEKAGEEFVKTGILKKTDGNDLRDDIQVSKISGIDINDKNLRVSQQCFFSVTETDDTSNPDLSTFLSTILVELGILTQQDHNLTLADQAPRSLELETGDGNRLTLELEEADEVEVNQEIPMEMEIEIDENEPNENEENSVVIKYITTNHKRRNKKQDKIQPKFVDSAVSCSICDKTYASRSAAVRHQREHSGERPHACVTCGRRFVQRAVLLRHQLVHEEHRPFKCSSCPKSYTQRGSLAAHARSHAPPHARPLRLHRCPHCTKVFLHASGLSRHMTIHNGRIYVCGSCDRQYRDKSSLIRHLKNSNHAPHTEAAHLAVNANGIEA